ncbi:g11372 [Coccomyxa elongata]
MHPVLDTFAQELCWNIGEPLAQAVFYALSDYPATLLAREAYIAANEIQSQIYSGVMPLGNAMAQYELAIPLERAGDCFTQINEFVYINKSIDLSAFTYFSQVRYLNEETAYIAPTNGGPRVFLNLEDHNSFNSPNGPVINTDFHKLVKFIKDTCNPRFHWAKAGWPRYFSCYDGAAYFPETWCDFGCAGRNWTP